MARINFVRLKLEPTAAAHIYKATVKFRLGFNQSDHGQKFNYSIKLVRADVAVGEAAQPDLPAVLYRFKFGKKFSKRVIGGPFTTVEPTTETRLVLAKDLNEDPETEPFNEVIPPPPVDLPEDDEISAFVTLTKGGGPFVQFIETKSSNVVTVTI